MTREELEHIVGAAANVLGEDAFVVVGSQAILGSHPDAPPELLRSIEADIYPKEFPERADEIDGSLGDGSPFHAAYGYYAHGVGPETAKAPSGWQDRLIPIDVPGRVASDRNPVAYCLEPHDWCWRNASLGVSEIGTSQAAAWRRPWSIWARSSRGRAICRSKEAPKPQSRGASRRYEVAEKCNRGFVKDLSSDLASPQAGTTMGSPVGTTRPESRSAGKRFRAQETKQ